MANSCLDEQRKSESASGEPDVSEYGGSECNISFVKNGDEVSIIVSDEVTADEVKEDQWCARHIVFDPNGKLKDAFLVSKHGKVKIRGARIGSFLGHMQEIISLELH